MKGNRKGNKKFTRGQRWQVTYWTNRGLKPSEIAKKTGMTAKQVSNLNYRRGYRKGIAAPTTNVPSGWHTDSGRRDKFTYKIFNITPESAETMSSHDLRKVVKEMQKKVKKEYDAVNKKFGNSPATDVIDRRASTYTAEHIYFGEQKDIRNLRKQFNFLREYLITYKTGSVSGYKNELSSIGKRIEGLSGKKGSYAKLSNEQRSEYWKKVRKLYEHIGATNIKSTLEGKDYYWGSDEVQSLMYDLYVDDNNYELDDSLINFLDKISDRVYEIQMAEDEEKKQANQIEMVRLEGRKAMRDYYNNKDDEEYVSEFEKLLEMDALPFM